MKQENKNIVGEKYIRDDNGVLAFNEEERKKHGNSIMKTYLMSNFLDKNRICQLLIQ